MTTPAAGPAWSVERHRGPAEELHGRAVDDDGRRRVWILEVEAPAIVLGSTQHASVVSRDRAQQLGVDVARRRSGGGAVWVAPGDPLWVDIVVPRGDQLWDDDVARSFAPIGRAWHDALLDVGTELTGLEVHAGSMRSTAWSSLVCFSGLGPGEVTAAGRKVVGISQRRTRAGARFQCAVYRRWAPGLLVEVLDRSAWPEDASVDEVEAAAVGIGDVSVDEVVEALIPQLA